MMRTGLVVCLAFSCAGAPLFAGASLPGTQPLDAPDEVRAIVREQLRQVIDYFERRVRQTRAVRDQAWRPDFSSPKAYEQSLAKHRSQCRQMLGLDDARPKAMQAESKLMASTTDCRIERITVTRSHGLSARGILFLPTKGAGASAYPAIVALPDADTWPERFTGLEPGRRPSDWLSTLLARGAAVYVPQSVERLRDHPYCKTTHNKDLRLILHRLGYPVGRSMTGLDVADVLAAVDYLSARSEIDSGRIGVVGIGQGGMTALFAAALDRRIAAAAVADYFETHDQCHEEPYDRRLPARLLTVGDAELAALIAPRRLAVVCSKDFATPERDVTAEFRRAQRFYDGLKLRGRLVLRTGIPRDKLVAAAVRSAAGLLDLPESRHSLELPKLRITAEQIRAVRDTHFEERLKYLRRLIAESEAARDAHWKLTARPASEFPQIKQAMLREYRQHVGCVPTEGTPLEPRTELALETEKYKLYRVMLDVTEGVELYGHLLVPKCLRARVAAVIAQHGLSGTPEMISGLGRTADTPYHEFGRHLAERGYVVFAPLILHHHPVKQVNDQVMLAEAAGMMRVAMVVAKTRRAIDFLQSLPFVDPVRIGYYGLSYGGYSALWAGPLLQRLKVIIPSGHFNDWRTKITTDRTPTSFLLHPDEDMYSWDVLHRFTHPELIAMMLPRPVCIEFGERDGITTPEWTAYAWKQVVSIRDHLGPTDRVELAHYDGVHEVHGIETFDFLDRFLQPDRPVGRDGEPLVEHVLDSRPETRITGRFWIPAGATQLRGMSIRLSCVGEPGPLEVRFGTAPGKQDLGVATLPAGAVPHSKQTWCPFQINPQPVRPGQLVYSEISCAKGSAPKDHYVIYGPRPLGGKHWGTGFGLSYRVLTDRPPDR